MKKFLVYILCALAALLCLSACTDPALPPEVTTVDVEQKPPTPPVSETDGLGYEPLTDTTCKVVSYVGDDRNPVIPTKDSNDRLVVAIGRGAFEANDQIVSVKLPLSVQTIEAEAFRGCSSLRTVEWPTHLVTVEASAFADCVSLTEITLPATVSKIGENAFVGCSALSRIQVDKANPYFTSDGQLLTSKDGSHLYLAAADGGLTAFESGDKLTAISPYAFAGHKTLATVTLGDGVREIGSYAFSDCLALASLSVGAGVTDIPDGLCRRGRALAQVTLSGDVEVVGASAFDGCTALAELSVPATVTRVGIRAFEGTAWLASQEQTFVTVGSGVLIAWRGEGTDVVIPGGVTYISDAFHGKKITSVTLPDTLIHIGENAFRSCQNLERVSLPTALATIGESAFYGCTALAHVDGLDNLARVTVAEGNAPLTALMVK